MKATPSAARLVEAPERGRRFELWEFEEVKSAAEAIV
jgi:hypothetical protein